MSSESDAITVPLRALRAAVPRETLEVCQTLSQAGYQAWTVGGAVRDVLLGRHPGDWDVTTDALPETVCEIFPRTIPTGIQHGTVTVLVGRGESRHAIEVTTFRGEGSYTDARRPDSVHFGVGLEEDLKRRDFVINAMAFDPVHGLLFDPFGGQDDIRDRRVRAVGTARDRFAEDGLRVMRAVRFVSTLDFELDAETEAGIAPALPSLARVAQERVRVELFKLLAGPAAGRGLTIARRVGILGVILPELEALGFATALARVELAPPDPAVRLAALLLGSNLEVVDACLRRLRVSNDERKRILSMAEHTSAFVPALEGGALRRHLSRVGRRHLDDHLALAQAEAQRREWPTGDGSHLERARRVLADADPLSIGELAIGGKEIMAATRVRGKELGALLDHLLELVLDDPRANQHDRLLEEARRWASESTAD